MPTILYRDTSRSILAENESPDVGFRFSLNPYRGCEHGCSYCYARPSHEYLGLGAGIDFESKIFVKRDAPELLRRELMNPNWTPHTLSISGVTDNMKRGRADPSQIASTSGALEGFRSDAGKAGEDGFTYGVLYERELARAAAVNG